MPGLVPGIHVLVFRKQEGVDGRDRPGHDRSWNCSHAPGKSRMRLATMPSITSLVPPSIEFALVRSQ